MYVAASAYTKTLLLPFFQENAAGCSEPAMENAGKTEIDPEKASFKEAPKIQEKYPYESSQAVMFLSKERFHFGPFWR